MRTHDFDKLVESIKQAGKIRRGEMNASRIFKVKLWCSSSRTLRWMYERILSKK